MNTKQIKNEYVNKSTLYCSNEIGTKINTTGEKRSHEQQKEDDAGVKREVVKIGDD